MEDKPGVFDFLKDAKDRVFAKGAAGAEVREAKLAAKGVLPVGERAVIKAEKAAFKLGKAGPWKIAAGVAVLAAVTSPFWRNKKRFNPNDVEPMPVDLAAPLPPVMMAPEMQGQQTLMGQTPVAGAMAQRIMAQRGGVVNGVDPGQPSVVGANGVNSIDGTAGPVPSLGR